MSILDDDAPLQDKMVPLHRRVDGVRGNEVHIKTEQWTGWVLLSDDEKARLDAMAQPVANSEITLDDAIWAIVSMRIIPAGSGGQWGMLYPGRYQWTTEHGPYEVTIKPVAGKSGPTIKATLNENGIHLAQGFAHRNDEMQVVLHRIVAQWYSLGTTNSTWNEWQWNIQTDNT